MSKRAKTKGPRVKKNRRTVSLPYPLFWAFFRYCQENDLAKAGVVTELVRAYLEEKGAPTAATPPEDYQPRPGPAPGMAGGHHAW